MAKQPKRASTPKATKKAAKKAPTASSPKAAKKVVKKVTKRPPVKGAAKAVAKPAGKKGGPGKSESKVEELELPSQLPADGASTAEVKPNRPTADASREFAQLVASTAANTRCTDVVIMDVKGLSPITDYLVLATGQSGRQMRAVAQEVTDLGKERGYTPLSTCGTEGEVWICADFVDVILHVFSPDSRGYYDLEGLWGDAKRVEFDASKPLGK